MRAPFSEWTAKDGTHFEPQGGVAGFRNPEKLTVLFFGAASAGPERQERFTRAQLHLAARPEAVCALDAQRPRLFVPGGEQTGGAEAVRRYDAELQPGRVVVTDGGAEIEAEALNRGRPD